MNRSGCVGDAGRAFSVSGAAMTIHPRWTSDPVYWRLIRLLAKFGKPGIFDANRLA